MSQNEVVSELIRKLEQTGLADRPGRLLQSGVGTINRGQLYMLGDNPGGSAAYEDDSPKEHLEALRNKPPYWNEYVHGIWRPKGHEFPPGEAGMQRRVRALLAALGLPVESVCASNLIFLRTPGLGDLGGKHEMTTLADQCWPVHQYLLQKVQPKAILCIGKGSFEYILTRGVCESGIDSAPSGQSSLLCRSARVTLDDLTVNLISVPHLGDRVRYDITNYPEALLWVRTKLCAHSTTAPHEVAISGSLTNSSRKQGRVPVVATKLRNHGIRDDDVFTYVRPINDSQYEKIPGTRGHARYLLFQTGMTVREFLSSQSPGNPPERVDITYNIKVRPRQRTPNLELSPSDSQAAIQARKKYLRKLA